MYKETEAANLRKEIVLALNKQQVTTSLYEELKCCLVLDESKKSNNFSEWVGLDSWFDGVITSLFFRPSNKILVLVGEQGIGKTELFRRLLPQKEWFSDFRAPYSDIPDLYNNLIVDMSEFDVSKVKRAVSNDGFKIVNPNTDKPRAEKRLASVCYSTNNIKFSMENRKRCVILYLKKIDWIKFDSIPKDLLWIEIYNRFLEKKLITELFSREDINNFFK